MQAYVGTVALAFTYIPINTHGDTYTSLHVIAQAYAFTYIATGTLTQAVGQAT